MTGITYLCEELLENLKSPDFADVKRSCWVANVSCMHKCFLNVIFVLWQSRTEVFHGRHLFNFPHEDEVLAHVCVQNIVYYLLSYFIVVIKAESF